MAIRGSPAKGVDWDDRCVGSNPTFSAKQRGGQFALLFAYQKETWDLNGHGSEWIASGDPEPCPRPAPQRRSNPTFSAKQRGGQFALLFAYQKETWDLNGHGSEWIASGDPEPCPRPVTQHRSNPTPAHTQAIEGCCLRQSAGQIPLCPFRSRFMLLTLFLFVLLYTLV